MEAIRNHNINVMAKIRDETGGIEFKPYTDDDVKKLPIRYKNSLYIYKSDTDEIKKLKKEYRENPSEELFEKITQKVKEQVEKMIKDELDPLKEKVKKKIDEIIEETKGKKYTANEARNIKARVNRLKNSIYNKEQQITMKINEEKPIEKGYEEEQLKQKEKRKQVEDEYDRKIEEYKRIKKENFELLKENENDTEEIKKLKKQITEEEEKYKSTVIKVNSDVYFDRRDENFKKLRELLNKPKDKKQEKNEEKNEEKLVENYNFVPDNTTSLGRVQQELINTRDVDKAYFWSKFGKLTNLEMKIISGYYPKKPTVYYNIERKKVEKALIERFDEKERIQRLSEKRKKVVPKKKSALILDEQKEEIKKSNPIVKEMEKEQKEPKKQKEPKEQKEKKKRPVKGSQEAKDLMKKVREGLKKSLCQEEKT